MALIVPFAPHFWKNWRPISAYFKRTPMAIAMALSLVGGLAFGVPAMTATGGGSPQRAGFDANAGGSVAEVASASGTETTAVVGQIAALRKP